MLIPGSPAVPVLLPHFRMAPDGLRTLAGREIGLPPDLLALIGRLDGRRTAAELDEPERLARLEQEGVIALVPSEAPSASLPEERPADLVVISPHLDDAPLSLGAALARLAAGGVRCRVVNVFSRQSYQTGLRVPPEELDRVGEAEEALAARLLGYRPRALGLAGARDRHGLGLRETLGWTPDRVAASPVHAREVAELAEQLADEVRGAAAVLAPLGLGGHLDHVIAGLAARAAAGSILCRYEDLPYAAALAGPVEEDSCRLAAGVGYRLELDSGPALELKRRALRVYRTRLRGPQIDLSLGWAEALWLP